MTVSNCGCGGACGECNQGLGVADWVQGLITTGVNTASNVVSSRYGVPPAGTSVVQRNPDGSYSQVVRSNFAVGGTAGVFPGPSFDSSTIITFGVVAIVGIALLKFAGK